jgi:hypothetical protein
LISHLSLSIPIILSSPCFSFSSPNIFLSLSCLSSSLFHFPFVPISTFLSCFSLSFYLSLFPSLSLFATYFSPYLLQEPNTTTPSLCVRYML